MQPDDPEYGKLAKAHFGNAIVIGVPDHESGEAEKEVDSQKAVTDEVLARIGKYPFHEVE